MEGPTALLTRRTAMRLLGAAAAATIPAVAACQPRLQAPANVAPAKVQVLDAWGPGPWTDQLYADWGAALKAKYPKIEVEFIMTPQGTTSTEKTLAMIAAGIAPDVTLGSAVDFALAGHVVNLEPFFRNDKEASSWEWNPPSWEFVNITLEGGKKMLWAMPGNSDARVIYVNVDLLEREGIKYTPDKPWTWEEFRQYAKALTKRKGDGSLEQVGFNGLTTGITDLHVFLTYANGDVYQRNPTTGWVEKSILNSPQSLVGLEYYHRLAVEDRVGIIPGESTAGIGFPSGTVAMQPSWSSYFSTMNQQTKQGVVTFKWDLMGYPVQKAGDKWPNQFANGSQMGSIMVASKAQDAGFQVLKYVAGPEGHLVRQRAMGAPPSIMNIKSLWDEWLAPPPQNKWIYQRIMAAGKIGPWSKIRENSAEIGRIYTAEVTRMLKGEIGYKEFADSFTDQANRLLTAR